MKAVLMCAALSAICMYGQEVSSPRVDAKLPLGTTTGQSLSTPTERPLTETELLKIRATTAEIKLLRDEYKVDEFNQKVQPKSAEQLAVFTAACKSVGVPEDKIQTECGIATGFDQDGKPMNGADGKPVQPKVWWAKPPAEKK